MKKIKLYIKIALGVFALGMLVFALMPNPVLVDIGRVERGDVLVSLDGEGKTKIRDIYVVYSPIEGRVTRIEREQGDSVAAGETVIANMRPADPRFIDSRTEIQAQADIQGAEAALGFEVAKLERAEAELEFAKAELERTKRLYDNGNVSIARLERAQLTLRLRETELNTAKSGMVVADSVLAAAKARLVQPSDNQGADSSTLVVRAPVSGKVLRLLHESEGVIPAGTPLVEVGNPEDLEIVIEMLSRDAVKVEAGDTALIKRWGGDEDILAQVRVVSPSGFTKISALGVEEQRVNVYLDFIDPIEKWRGLGDAFRVEASIIVDQSSDVLYVPISALFRYEENWNAFVVEDGIAIRREVEIGKMNDQMAEIKKGLDDGGEVIIHPGSNISDGVRVEQR
ncbi:efflux RND transporter periplasmic adaptor subunit [Pseudemcibacter aquimaris]|uniref:efflux RND transporter periplasmic adaptor subunit n=1 Tax=Pseudemcibacter aquimaris TaxID=2857064 RepID=UPI0020122EAB|nr:HlyD family efflux transporter periplasmic adaptor subunit [Pseudemcibacter aquimaris]MCC3860957.1 efflux RND transporter periplasmic adaptor subunit [Pseudemcibacter aquimaris]WDU59775.1 efflux RND transporter periplasmic adaptor subunit [Pseudemcibacter aquimaris]